jgi:hypothetical protein
MTSFVRPLAAGLLLGLIPAPAYAQGRIAYSTLGPGDSFVPSAGGWTVGASGPSPNRAVAGYWDYTLGDRGQLDHFRVAIGRTWVGSTPATAIPLDASILVGADINTATVLESFSRSIRVPGVDAELFTFSSVLHPTLLPGQRYWIALSVDPSSLGHTSWTVNSQGIEGVAARSGTGPWSVNPAGSLSPVFDVVVIATPEPITAALVAVGLIGAALATQRRRNVVRLPFPGPE